jgi:hypothetical protein
VRSHPMLRPGAMLLAAFALSSCEGSTTPQEPLANVYVLTRLNGAVDPMILADHTYPSGTRAVWVVTYDTIRISSSTEGLRKYEVLMVTEAVDGVTVAPVLTPISRKAYITRRGERLIFEYDQTGSPIKPDTMVLRDGNLIKQGPFGVSCGTNCAPPPRVEYVYEPRGAGGV